MSQRSGALSAEPWLWGLSAPAILTAVLLLAALALLVLSRVGADLVFLAVLTVLMLCGIISPQQAFSGLANEGVLAVGALFVVAAGVRQTGAVQWLVRHVLGTPSNVMRAQLRLGASTSLFSAFVSNSPVVAMLIPAVSDWASRLNVPPSRFLMPLSFAAMLGGMCTLIGTSTNLIVNGLLIDATGNGLGLFDITPIGLPAALAGLVVLVLCSSWLLPARAGAEQQFDNIREYTIEMMVDQGGSMDGLSIQGAGLRHLPGCYLAEVIRDGEVIAGIGPHRRLQGGDRLVFVGAVDSVVNLQRLVGLRPATDQLFKLDAPHQSRRLVEAVVSDSSPMVEQTIREGGFRTRYGAVILAISRQGQRLPGRLGDVQLRAGDTLLLEASPAFLSTQRYSRDFFLVREIDSSNRPDSRRAMVALGVLLTMAVTVATGLFSLLEGSLLAAGAMLATRCVSAHAARLSVDWTLLLTIAATIGIGTAFMQTGLDQKLAAAILSVGQANMVTALSALFIGTALLSLIITNNAAAVLSFPVALQLANVLQAPVVPFAIACMLGASASFMTPFGYQTNLMVMGPGGYRFSDYLRLGGVLTLVVGITVISALSLRY